MADSNARPGATATPARNAPGEGEQVGRSGIYPASGPHPPGPAQTRGQGALAHPEERDPRRLLPAASRGTWPLLVGRAVFGGFFLYNGINHFRNRDMLIGYAKSKGVPAAEVAVLGTGALLIAGSLSLITGLRPKLGASLVSSFLLGVSPQMHAFWKEEDPQQQMNEMVNFTKNMALVGGAMFAAALPEPWRYALAR